MFTVVYLSLLYESSCFSYSLSKSNVKRAVKLWEDRVLYVMSQGKPFDSALPCLILDHM